MPGSNTFCWATPTLSPEGFLLQLAMTEVLRKQTAHTAPPPRGSSGASGAVAGKAAADREPDATLAAALLTFGTPRHSGLSASDERRLRKRAAAVAAVKRLTPSYTFKRAGRPSTPDPSDLSISKRRWEASVEKWRRELRTVEL